MTEDTKLSLAFGRQNFPDNVQAVWGARLIWPNDLVHDRQDIASSDDKAKADLIAWLNGPNQGDGALRKALTVLKVPTDIGLTSTGPEEAVIYEDDKGKIVGSAQSSYGYCYVSGWLKEHTA